MARDIKRAIFNARETFVADAFGAAALVVLMSVALYAPVLF